MQNIDLFLRFKGLSMAATRAKTSFEICLLESRDPK